MIAVVFIVTAAAAAPASALTIDELQTQIKELLAKVSTLQLQLQTAVGGQISPADPTTGISTVMPKAHRICSILARNLSQGAQGDDVRGLQEFLQEEKIFTGVPTGYFGSLTAQALAKWQASQGVSAVGILGPMSRERIKVWCGGGRGNSERFNASPTRGDAPLSVTFSTWLSGFRPSSIYYTIDFGDGTSERAANCLAPADACVSPGENKHTYTQNGTYTATLNKITDPCPDDGNPNTIRCMAAMQSEIVAKAQIHVGPQACTMEYSPVCGSKPIVCITTPCNPIQQTYGNRCAMNADGATFLYEGACRSDMGVDSQCKAWFTGCTKFERAYPGGPEKLVPTTNSCTSNSNAPRCVEYFSTSTNKPPTISSFSGPTSLAVNASGTWTVQASDPENQSLKYSIVWGDEFQGLPAFINTAMRDVFVQESTFTHSYARAGTYTVIVVVTDSSGAIAKTTSTVRVGTSEPVACTLEYAPVCGQVTHACLSSNPPAMCAFITLPMNMSEYRPQTYSNRCMMNAAGASFLYSGQCQNEVACTADARQCPNGSYVGRTGPNCEFVCPNSTTN